ncbi:SDR family oxidoreductase [Streptomyces hoynatensis]|uniref:SDR family oxidoreductase n=1 Tax=Streptomyces hoynatensis TaxID=1141874 RepID=A0A3A9YWM0_9ACTN|nr:SDR family oxidoreductase [Streptomyces hoynatensis]RKN40482.1 SDR family oxidoreductase [Streptomyces hoynatensis]
MSALRGKTALVTGASRGIGRAIAERLGRDGARVAVHFGGNETAAKETVAAIEAAGGSAFPVQATLGEPGDAEALWAAFDERSGGSGVDILVNNAGIDDGRQGLAGTAQAAFDRVFAVNVRAPFFLVQQGVARLRDGGRIVNVSTALTHAPGAMPQLVAYTMTKAAIDAFTATLAKELGPRGITVNAVAPGAIDTDMNADWLRADPQARAAAAQSSPLGRVGMPEDVADVVGFLASEDSRWVTGQWIDAAGGVLL